MMFALLLQTKLYTFQRQGILFYIVDIPLNGDLLLNEESLYLTPTINKIISAKNHRQSRNPSKNAYSLANLTTYKNRITVRIEKEIHFYKKKQQNWEQLYNTTF